MRFLSAVYRSHGPLKPSADTCANGTCGFQKPVISVRDAEHVASCNCTPWEKLAFTLGGASPSASPHTAPATASSGASKSNRLFIVILSCLIPMYRKHHVINISFSPCGFKRKKRRSAFPYGC